MKKNTKQQEGLYCLSCF